MRKLMIAALVAMLAVGFVVLTGCGGTKTTEEKIEKAIETETGVASDTTVTTKAVTEEDIGVPIYPGAKLDENSAGSVTSKSESGKTTYSAAVLWTGDSPEKVITWYKDKLSGKPGFTDMSAATGTQGSEPVGLFMFQSGNTMKTVTIGKNESSDHPGKTTIAMASASGADIENLPK